MEVKCSTLAISKELLGPVGVIGRISRGVRVCRRCYYEEEEEGGLEEVGNKIDWVSCSSVVWRRFKSSADGQCEEREREGARASPFAFRERGRCRTATAADSR